MTVQDLLGKEHQYRLPANDVAMVRSGSFYWAAVHKNQEEDGILFRLPKTARIPNDIDGIWHPNGHSYLMCLYLSWKGIPVYSGRFIVDSFGKGIHPPNFEISKL